METGNDVLFDPLLPPASQPGNTERPLPAHLKELIDFVLGEPMATLVIAIDPGDVHCGIAVGGFPPNGTLAKRVAGEVHSEWVPVCYRTIELTQAECLFFAAHTFRHVRAVALEIFALFPDKAAVQAGSTMPTSRLIGALEYIASTAVEGAYYQGLAVRTLDSFLFEQQPAIKEGTIANLRARGLPSHAKTHHTGDHCFDAELHLYHFLYSLLTPKEESATVRRSEWDSSGPPKKGKTAKK